MAEGLILLSYIPSLLIIKANLDQILRVDTMIYWVLRNLGVFYLYVEAHLKEMWPTEIIQILRATFDMLHKDFWWVEAMAEFALHRFCMLEALGEYFEFLHFQGKFIVFVLLLGNSLRQVFICFLELSQLLQVFLSRPLRIVLLMVVFGTIIIVSPLLLNHCD